MIFRIQSMSKACASIDEANIIVSSCTDDVAAGYRLDSLDDLGNVQHYFLSDSRVWLVACPNEAGDLIGFPIEINRPYWADIILAAATAFLASI